MLAVIRAFIYTWVSNLYLYLPVFTTTSLKPIICIAPYCSGYMLLYLTAIQAIAQLASHCCNTRTAAALLTGCLVFGASLAGGYTVHLSQLPVHWQWAQLVSPQRWLLPLLTADEYSSETLANTAGQQLCRNKQVRMRESVSCIIRLLINLTGTIENRCNTRKSSYSIRVRRPTAPPFWPTCCCNHSITFCCWEAPRTTLRRRS